LNDRPLRLQWITNYTRLAAATMFTLFFAGNDFAPHTRIEGEPVQEFLQRHYIDAFKQVARKLSDLPNVAGFGTMNEPSSGFIGLADLHINTAPYLALGPSPTPFQAMVLGAGYPQEVDFWEVGLRGHRPRRKVRLNSQGIPAWQEDRVCIWREHGVWDLDSSGQPQFLQPNYLVRYSGNATPVVCPITQTLYSTFWPGHSISPASDYFYRNNPMTDSYAGVGRSQSVMPLIGMMSLLFTTLLFLL
jgi:hypothetical protein